MDAWNPDQLLKMQAGGNNRCNDFLRQYGIAKDTDIKEKYNSQAAEVLYIQHYAIPMLQEEGIRHGMLPADA